MVVMIIKKNDIAFSKDYDAIYVKLITYCTKTKGHHTLLIQIHPTNSHLEAIISSTLFLSPPLSSRSLCVYIYVYVYRSLALSQNPI